MIGLLRQIMTSLKLRQRVMIGHYFIKMYSYQLVIEKRAKKIVMEFLIVL